MSVQAWMRDPKNHQLCARFLKEAGLDGTPDEVEHLGVMLEAMEIYEDRERTHGSHWRQAGAIDNLKQVRRKTSRQLNVAMVVAGGEDYNPPSAALAAGADDDAIDVINYTVFAVRNMRAINFDFTEDPE